MEKRSQAIYNSMSEVSNTQIKSSKMIKNHFKSVSKAVTSWFENSVLPKPNEFMSLIGAEMNKEYKVLDEVLTGSKNVGKKAVVVEEREDQEKFDSNDPMNFDDFEMESIQMSKAGSLHLPEEPVYKTENGFGLNESAKKEESGIQMNDSYFQKQELSDSAQWISELNSENEITVSTNGIQQMLPLEYTQMEEMPSEEKIVAKQLLKIEAKKQLKIMHMA